MIIIKNYPIGDKNGATQKAESDLNTLKNQGYSIVSSSTATTSAIDSTKKKFEFVLLTVILEK